MRAAEATEAARVAVVMEMVKAAMAAAAASAATSAAAASAATREVARKVRPRARSVARAAAARAAAAAHLQACPLLVRRQLAGVNLGERALEKFDLLAWRRRLHGIDGLRRRRHAQCTSGRRVGGVGW